MERPIHKPIGTPVQELDTPALVVDLAKLDANIETVHAFFRDRSAKLRPYVPAHGSPAIAHLQLAGGGTVGGIATATLGQAEVFAASGFDDIFVMNILVTPAKISRLCALARRARVTVAVDNPANLRDLSEAAVTANATVNVVVDVDTGCGHTGVEPGGPAVDLARAADAADGVRFAGLMGRSGPFGDGQGDGEETARQRVQRVLDTAEAVEAAGLEVEMVNAGGTSTYEAAGGMSGVTEVPAGSYALMDEGHRSQGSRLAIAARVMSCITSMPEAGNVITDAGRKAICVDAGNPALDGFPGASVRGLSAEHGGIDVDPNVDHGMSLGDRVWLIPRDIAGCVNVHDYIHAVRDGRLEAVWELPARGRYR